ncbi:hypothetical protein ACOSP7_020276 [Xanthoceras sorbifolium]
MDGGMGWHGSLQVLTNPSMSSLWSNQLQDNSEESSFMVSNSNNCYGGGTYGDKKMDFSTHDQEDMFNLPIQVLQRAHDHQSSSHVHQLLNSNPERPQESTAVGKSAGGGGWGQELMCCSSLMIDRPCVSSLPLSSTLVGVVDDHFGMDGQAQIFDHGGKAGGGVSTTTCSDLESLDCLLSATNSNTDTSVTEDDDGISIILADCRNHLWNFGANTSTAAVSSSGESENNPSIDARNYKELEETVSQSSSDQHFNDGRIIQEERPNSSKRSSDQREVKVATNNNGQFHLLHQIGDSSLTEGGFRLISDNPPKQKKLSSDHHHHKHPSSSNINFQQPSSSLSSSSIEEPDPEAIAHMKEMIYRAAAFRPVNLGMEVAERPKRKNVRISSDPQTVAARQRRERISERIRVLQRLVPGGNKMDTASMLDEAANYLKFLRSQVKALENIGHKFQDHPPIIINNGPSPSNNLAATTFSSLPFNNHNNFSTTFPMQTHLSPLQNPNNPKPF